MNKIILNILTILYVIVALLCIIGYIRCVIKFIHCDFKAPYKCEVVYGVGTFTGAGAIIGYVNVDSK